MAGRQTLTIRRSLRGAINAFCRACIHDPHAGAGTWREQVTACTSTRCPLFAVRPVTGKAVKAPFAAAAAAIAAGQCHGQGPA